MQRVVRSGDVRTIRIIFSMAKPLGIAVPVLLSIGGVFGLIAAIEIGFGLADPWLIISYVVFAIAMVAGGAVQGPWSEKVAKAANVSPDDAPSPELQRLLRDQKAKYASWILDLLILVIIYVMVVKPFSYGKDFF